MPAIVTHCDCKSRLVTLWCWSDGGAAERIDAIISYVRGCHRLELLGNSPRTHSQHFAARYGDFTANSVQQHLRVASAGRKLARCSRKGGNRKSSRALVGSATGQAIGRAPRSRLGNHLATSGFQYGTGGATGRASRDRRERGLPLGYSARPRHCQRLFQAQRHGLRYAAPSREQSQLSVFGLAHSNAARRPFAIARARAKTPGGSRSLCQIADATNSD